MQEDDFQDHNVRADRVLRHPGHFCLFIYDCALAQKKSLHVIGIVNLAR